MRCCEDEEWQSTNSIDSLAAGTAQPFYHVLVDLRDWEDGNPQAAITYVPEELLQEPEVRVRQNSDQACDLRCGVECSFSWQCKNDSYPLHGCPAVSCGVLLLRQSLHFRLAWCPSLLFLHLAQSSETWSEEHGDDTAFIHPFAGMLFLGNDHAGDFLPSKPLREKYSAQRRDVGPSDEDDEQDDADDSPDGSSPPFGGPGGSGSGGPSGFDIGGPGGGLTIM